MEKKLFCLFTVFALFFLAVVETQEISSTYVGKIEINGRKTNVETTLQINGSVITGSYRYGPEYQTRGVFTSSVLEQYRLRCVWQEGGMTGNFDVTFNTSFTSFRGTWNFSNGMYGGTWDGLRQKDKEADGYIVLGTYIGKIEINGRKTNVETTLQIRDGIVTGSYRYGPEYQTRGVFLNSSLQQCHLRSTWQETTYTGNFDVTFDPSFASFRGTWNFSNGMYGGTWDGLRQKDKEAGDIVLGTYVGKIEINGRKTNVETTLQIRDGVVTGSYRYGPEYQTRGVFLNSSLQQYRLRSTWQEDTYTGNFDVTFDPSFTSFKGTWNFSNGMAGGSWDGRK